MPHLCIHNALSKQPHRVQSLVQSLNYDRVIYLLNMHGCAGVDIQKMDILCRSGDVSIKIEPSTLLWGISSINSPYDIIFLDGCTCWNL